MEMVKGPSICRECGEVLEAIFIKTLRQWVWDSDGQDYVEDEIVDTEVICPNCGAVVPPSQVLGGQVAEDGVED